MIGKKGNKLKGFTLIELVIAMAVSSLVALGLFSIFSSIAGVRDRSIIQSQNITLAETLTRLMNRDARMMISGSLGIDESGEVKKLKWTTQNSLRFNKALPVEISYYIDEDNWLVRRETNTDTLFDMEMRIIPDVSDMKVYFYDGSEYKESVINDAKMVNIEFIVNGVPLTVPAVRTMDNVQ